MGYLFIRTKRKCNNDFHQRSFHINSSNITGYHHILTTSEIHEKFVRVKPKVLYRKIENISPVWSISCLLHLSVKLHRIPEFSMFKEIPEYSRFSGLSRFVASLKFPENASMCKSRTNWRLLLKLSKAIAMTRHHAPQTCITESKSGLTQTQSQTSKTCCHQYLCQSVVFIKLLVAILTGLAA